MVLPGKFPIPFLATCLILSGCDSTSGTAQLIGQTDAAQNSFDVRLPEKIRTSLAVDFSRVEGIATVNGRFYQMERVDNRFRATVPDIQINSEVTVDLLFRETLPSGQILNLAETAPRTFSVGSTDTTIEISEEQFSYSFDDDNDGLSNISERNDGTDPFVPQDAGTRTITAEFNLPQIIEAPDIIQVTVLMADEPRGFSRQESFVRSTGLVPNGSTIDVEVLLTQIFDGSTIRIGEAQSQVDAGDQNVTVFFQGNDFDFSIDTDNDGVSNIDEIQSGRDPFVPG